MNSSSKKQQEKERFLDVDRPWNLPLIGPDDSLDIRLPNFNFLTKFNTQLFLGSSLDSAKKKASIFHKNHNTQGLSEIVVIMKMDEQDDELISTEGSSFKFLYIISSNGFVKPMNSNFDSLIFDSTSTYTAAESTKQADFVKETIFINVYRDIFNLCAYVIESFIEKTIELPFDYKLTNDDQDPSHIRFVNNQKHDMVTYVINIPLKHEYMASFSKKRDMMVPTSLSAFPRLEKILYKLHNRQLDKDISYTQDAKNITHLGCLMAIEDDVSFIHGKLSDYERKTANPVGELNDNVDDNFNFSTILAKHIKKLSDTITEGYDINNLKLD